MKDDNVCELFCGAGGMGFGFEKYFNMTYAIDMQQDVVNTYQANHKNTDVKCTDVRNLTGATHDFTGLTGVVGGPPCQQWSRMNHQRKEDDARANLPQEFMRLVEEIKPKFYVIENVPYAPKPDKESIIAKGKALGYEVLSLYLNAADHGASQTRKRWIVVGLKGKKWTKPPIIASKSVKDAFSALTNNWGKMTSSAKTLEVLSRSIHDEWTPMAAGGFKNMIKLGWDTPSPAIVNLKKVYMVHPAENRNISLAEAASLQGFPPDYIWKGTESRIAQMIANAMPTEMATAIAGSIVDRGSFQSTLPVGA